MRMSAWVYCAAACGLAVLLFGCVSVQRSIPLAGRTPAYFGNVKLYGTDNVPFEYEEIASLAQGYDMFHHQQEECFKRFAEQAQELGADAVLNFKMEQHEGTGGFFLVLSPIAVNCGFMYLSGTAVKIKRP